MVREEDAIAEIKLEKDLVFKTSIGLGRFKDFFIDETLDNNKDLEGPDAAQMLGMAILSCLSASFIFCLAKRNLNLDDLEARAEISFKKIDRGYTRVKEINIKIVPRTRNEATLKRINQCVKEMKSGKMMFEENCIITESVREGIKVTVDIEI
ncbi:MAG: OsmC family protein [Promethearchaeota archaeon]